MKALLLWCIRFYRKHISPMKPPCCRFIPTCSTYALEAIEKYGAFKGGWLSLRRILKCHPIWLLRPPQWDRRTRPARRRRARTLRPLAVAIRLRKPWTLLR